ncbi:MAG: DEAD/DEAH box helicase [Hyphomicrobiales bacterium]|nr:DEAD/DEAH box helicase [Hyphomicrobiales bacterium]
MTFFDASPALSRALAERNYSEPTPVQAAVLKEGADDRDIIVSAQTGSGKTVAYGLALASTLLQGRERFEQAGAPLALAIAPTRELAMQVERELRWLYQYAGCAIVSCVGGMDARQERRRLSDGAHIVVGTPGRLRDHIERRGLDVSRLRAVVLDEADEMLDMGFREDLEFILDATPAERRTLLFSATMPRGIVALARRYQRDALRIEVEGDARGHADIEYRAIRVQPKEVEYAVVNLLRYMEAPTAMVFCNTREATRHLQAILLERGFSSVLLSGELSQHERNLSMQALRDGRARVCVATDVAARGIDLPNLELVIHAELPNDAETLQHRSGRTGRAGRKGVSALIVPPSRARRAAQLLANSEIEARWSGPPTQAEIADLDRQRMMQDPLLTDPASEDDVALGRQLLSERPAEELAAALVRIYRARLPSVEDVEDPGQSAMPDFRARHAAPARTPKGPRAMPDAVWFRLDIGRSRNADPKWLLPMLCRKGGVTRQDIGVIRIFDHETQFEVSQSLADQFLVSMRRPGGDNVRVERMGAGAGFDRPRDKKQKRKAAKSANRDGAPPPPAHEKRPGFKKKNKT